MRLPTLAFLLAASSATPLYAAGPVRTDDPARASAPATAAAQRPASKNAFGQAMAELARGLRNVRPADGSSARAASPDAPKPATVAAAQPASGG